MDCTRLEAVPVAQERLGVCAFPFVASGGRPREMGRRGALVLGVFLMRVGRICRERYSRPPPGPAAPAAPAASDRLGRSAAGSGDLAAASAVGRGGPVLRVLAAGVRA